MLSSARLRAAFFVVLVSLLALCLAASAPGQNGSGNPESESERQMRVAAEKGAAEAEARKIKRESPVEKERRGKSRSAFKGLSRDEALRVGREQHPKVLVKPAGGARSAYTEELKVKRFISTYAAVLEPKDKAKKFSGGKAMIVSSALPIRTVDEDGDQAQVDLALRKRDKGFAPATPVVATTLGEQAGDGVRIGRDGLAVEPIVARPGVVGEQSNDSVFYANVDTDADVISRPTELGAELFVQLRSADSPESLRFRIRRPGGTTLRLRDKAVEVMRDDEVLAQITAPAAWDAEDVGIPVELDLDGEVLTMRVEHRNRDVLYPVIADPNTALLMQHEWEHCAVPGSWCVNGHRYDGWNPHQIGPSWGRFQGHMWLGAGLYTWKTNDGSSSWFDANTYSFHRFVAPGKTSIVAADFNRFDHESPDGGMCLDYGIDSRNANGWIVGPYGSCGFERRHDMYHHVCWDCQPTNAKTWHDPNVAAVQFGEYAATGGWRGYYTAHLGDVRMWLVDPDAPTLNVTSPTATRWFNADTDQLSVTASDASLGVRKVEWHGPAGWDGNKARFDGWNEASNTGGFCYQWGACGQSRTLTAPVHNLPEGVTTVRAHAQDPTLEGGTHTADLDVPVRVDKTAPRAEVTNGFDKRRAVGPRIYDVNLHASDSTANAARVSGARSITVKVDDIVRQTLSTTAGCNENCSVTGTHKFDGQAPYGLAGADAFTGSAGTRLDSHAPTQGGSWAPSAGGQAGAVLTNAGRVRPAAPTSSPLYALYLQSAQPPVDDYEVSADVRVQTAPAGESAGVAARASGSSYYAAWVQSNGVHLMRVVNGAVQMLGSAGFSAYAGQNHRLTLRVRGKTLTVLVNGSKLIEREDTALSTGRGGIYFRTASASSDTTGLHLDNYALQPTSDRYSEGKHAIRVEAVDGAAKSAVPLTWNTIVDRTKPVIDSAEGSMRRPDGPGEYTLRVEARDPKPVADVAGVDRIILEVDGVPQPPAQQPTPGADLGATFRYEFKDENPHTFKVRAFDAADNEAQEQTFTAQADTTAPKVDLSGPLYDNDGKAIGGDSYGLNALATDARTGVTKMSFLVDDAEAQTPKTQACPAGGCPMQDYLEFFTTSRDDGVYTIKAVAEDRAGNKGSSQVTVIVDRGKPRIVPPVEHEGLPDGWTRGDTTVHSTITGADDGSGVKRLRLAVPGQPEQTHDFTCEGTVASRCPTSDADHTFSYDLTTADEGVRTIQARAEDALGRVSDPESWTVRVDRTGPNLALSGTMTEAAGGVLVAGAYNLRVDATDGRVEDPGSGPETVEIFVRREGRTDFERVRSAREDCGPDTWCSIRAEWTMRTDEYEVGTHTIRIVGDDVLGNESTSEFDVTVGPTVLPQQLGAGLEDFFDYESVETGAGSRGHVNLATGNFVWHATPIVNPGRGLASVVNLTYNAQVRAGDPVPAYDQLGKGFSLGVSSLTRINEPLDLTLAEARGPVAFTDPDGTRHVFEPAEDGGDPDLAPDHYLPPAGVQLHLRRYSRHVAGVAGPLVDPAKAWAATRPDGVTHFFDEGGYQTSVEDRNGNAIRYEYEYVLPLTGIVCAPTTGTSSPDDTPLCAKRLTTVTDAAGLDPAPGTTSTERQIQVAYWTEEDDDDQPEGEPGPSAGRISELTDHGGRKLRFLYDDAENLQRVTQAADTGDQRSFNFAYEGEGRHRYLTDVSDPNGAATKVDYEDEAQPAPTLDELQRGRRVLKVTNRRDNQTQVAYGTVEEDGRQYATAVVTRPRNFATGNPDKPAAPDAPPNPNQPRDAGDDGRSFTYEHRLDRRGRLVQLEDPRDTKTQLEWDGDNNVTVLDQAADSADAAQTTMAYNDNGLLTSTTDPVGNVTDLTYRDGAGVHRTDRGRNEVTGADFSSNDEDDDAFVSDLLSIETPRGNETASEGDFTTVFTVDDLGNVTQTLLPGDPAPSLTEYDEHGQIEWEQDPAGKRWVYDDYDANGLPRHEVDPRGNATADVTDGHWRRRYDSVGNVLAETDPRGEGGDGPDNQDAPFTTTLGYDALDRLIDERLPKRSEEGEFITRHHDYDANGNRTLSRDGNNAVTTIAYTAMDRPRELTSPAVGHHDGGTASEITRMRYDAHDNVVEQVAPEGTRTPNEANDHRTELRYDAIDRPVVEVRHAAADAADQDQLITSYAYDRRGNMTGLADPRRNATADGTPEANAGMATRQRYAYEYDLANRRLFAIEDPGGRALRTAYRYDRNDNVTHVTDARGFRPSNNPATQQAAHTTIRNHDERDLVTSVVDPLGRTSRIAYTPDRQVERVVSPRGTAAGDLYATVNRYDAGGSVDRRTLPRGAGEPTITFDYERNEVGDVERIVDGRGNEVLNEFFDGGQLRTTDRPSMWNVDARSGSVQLKDPSELGNDKGDPELPAAGEQGDFGQVEGEDMPDLLPRRGSVELEYDDEMRLSSIRELEASAAGATVRFGRDAVGRLTRLERPFDRDGDTRHPIVNRYAYDFNGNLREMTDGEGFDAAGTTLVEGWHHHTTTLGYDGFDRLIRRDAPGGNAGREITTTTYNHNGTVDLVTKPPTAVAATEDHEYDTLDRVTAVVRSGSNGLERTSYGYDEVGNPTMERSPRGNVGNRPEGECDPEQAGEEIGCFETHRTFDRANQLRTETDGLGHETRFDYDLDGNQIEVDEPGAAPGEGQDINRRVVGRTFDGRGLVAATTQVNVGGLDRTTVTEYDGNGNLRRVVKPAGVDDGEAIHPDNAPATTEPQNANHQNDANVRAATRNATLYEYDEDGLLLSEHLPWDDFDGPGDEADGAPEEVAEAARRRIRQDFRHDPRGRVSSIDAPYQWVENDRRECRYRDDDGETPNDNPACPRRTAYTHYDTGWIRTASDPRLIDPDDDDRPVGGQQSRYEYDRRGLQTRWLVTGRPPADQNSDAETRRSTERTYYANGRLATRVGRRGANDPTPRRYTYDYDARGGLTRLVDDRPAGQQDRVTEMEYDAADRRTRVNDTFHQNRDTRESYDANGNVTERRTGGRLDGGAYVGGKTATFAFDPLDREVTATIDRAGEEQRVVDSAYWPSGNRRTRERRRGDHQTVTDRWYFDDDGRLNQMVRDRPGRADPLKDQAYEYDANGNRTEDERGEHWFNARDQHVVWERGPRRRNSGSHVRYVLDGSGQMLAKHDGAGDGEGGVTRFAYVGEELVETTFDSNAPGANVQATTRYDHNPFGDVQAIRTTFSDGSEAPPPVRYAYDEFERVIRAEHPDEQNPLDRPVRSERFDYDGLDRRDTKCRTTGIDSGDCLANSNVDFSYVGLTESLADETAAEARRSRSYDYDSDLDRLGVTLQTQGEATPTHRFYAKDANGSVEGLENGATGEVAREQRYDYDPYGELERTEGDDREPDEESGDRPTAESGLDEAAQSNPFRFEGFYYDSGVKTYDMQARAYRPEVGRFLQQDRFEAAAGDFNLQSDPLTQNRYAFAGGNPVNRVEWDGHYSGNEGGAQLAMKGQPNRKETAKQRRARHTAPSEAVPRSAPQQVSPRTPPDTLDRNHRGQVQRRLDQAHRRAAIQVSREKTRKLVGGPSPLQKKSRATYPGHELDHEDDDRPGGTFGDFVGGFVCEFTWDKACFGNPDTEAHSAGRGAAMLNPKGAAQKLTREAIEEGTERAAKNAKKPGGGSTAAGCGMHSFSGATRVLMANGTARPISKLKVGDWVLAADPLTGVRAARRVTRVWVHDDTLVDLKVGGALVATTEDHPFWNATDGQWQDASSLDVGEHVLTADDDLVPVAGFAGDSARAGRAYNLTVDDLHTYFVAAGPEFVLVHNSGCNSIDDLPAQAARNLTTNADYAFQRLNRNHGVTRVEFREQIHAIKQHHDLPANFDVKFGPTGDVWNPQSGDLIGQIRHGG